MSDKSRNVLWIVAGMYLVYTGFSLIQNVLAGKPDKMVLLIGFGVLFIGAGAGMFIAACRKLYQGAKMDVTPVDEEEAEEGAREAAEAMKELEISDAADETGSEDAADDSDEAVKKEDIADETERAGEKEDIAGETEKDR